MFDDSRRAEMETLLTSLTNKCKALEIGEGKLDEIRIVDTGRYTFLWIPPERIADAGLISSTYNRPLSLDLAKISVEFSFPEGLIKVTGGSKPCRHRVCAVMTHLLELENSIEALFRFEESPQFMATILELCDLRLLPEEAMARFSPTAKQIDFAKKLRIRLDRTTTKQQLSRMLDDHKEVRFFIFACWKQLTGRTFRQTNMPDVDVDDLASRIMINSEMAETILQFAEWRYEQACRSSEEAEAKFRSCHGIERFLSDYPFKFRDFFPSVQQCPVYGDVCNLLRKEFQPHLKKGYGITGEGDVKTLMRESPSDWEFIYFSDRLNLEISSGHEIPPSTADFPFDNRDMLTIDNISDWISQRFSEFISLLQSIESVLVPRFNSSFGRLGEPGDPVEIASVARDLGAIYWQTVQWSLKTREAKCSDRLAKIPPLVAGLAIGTLEKIESFGHHILEHVRDALRDRSGNEKVNLTLMFDLKPPNLEATMEDLKLLVEGILGYSPPI